LCEEPAAALAELFDRLVALPPAETPGGQPAR
jgi:hypothetical protein